MQEEKRIGIKDYPLFNFGFAVSQPDETVKTIEIGEPYEIHGAWLQTTNPIACMGADPQRLYKALMKLDFIVVVDLFKTPTIAALADVVLPAQTFAERNGLAFISGAQRGRHHQQGHHGRRCKSDMEINLEARPSLESRGMAVGQRRRHVHRHAQAHGHVLRGAAEGGAAYQPIEYYRYEKGMLRPTASPASTRRPAASSCGATSTTMQASTRCRTSTAEPGPGSTPELMDEYPLVMTSGARFWGMFHSEHRQIERMRHYRPWPLMEIHPDTAAKYGIKDGDWVWMEAPMGRAKRKAKLTPIMDRRLVSCDRGWWFPEGDPEKFYDVFDLNINNALPWTPARAASARTTRAPFARSTKVKEGE